jgi:uncharacterized protein YndB with AHSA1/START domain
MYTISAESIIRGTIQSVWDAEVDVDNWAKWNPHEEEARLDGEFKVGGTGWSKPHGGPGTAWTITAVEPLHKWGSECALPGGKLVGESTFDDLGDGRIRCKKTVQVSGPLTILFRLHFGRGIKKDMYKSFEALEQEAARRVQK